MYEKECVEDLQQMMADAKVVSLPADVPAEDKEEIKSHIEKLALQIEQIQLTSTQEQTHPVLKVEETVIES